MLVLVPTVFEAVHLFGEDVRAPLLADGSVTVLPTTTLDEGTARWPKSHGTVAVCGFGLASSGSGAMGAMLAHRRDLGGAAAISVALVGISGTFDPVRAPVGTALVGTETICEGIGAGTGVGFVAAEAMGWSQGHSRSWLPSVGDRVPLVVPGVLSGCASGPILSVAAASGDVAHRDERARRHPEALVEEMEGYAVALAARLCRVNLTIIRGISNVVGDRNPANWKVAQALSAVRAALVLLASESPSAGNDRDLLRRRSATG